ncbi:PH and SEC7 domain-containing protein-like isoform X2 [Arctopsyche grandis]
MGRSKQSTRISHSNSLVQSNGCSEHSDKSSNGCGDWSDRSSNGCVEKGSSNGWKNSDAKEDDSSRRVKHNPLYQSAAGHNNRSAKQPKFEAYMMTGELMLKLSSTERSGDGVAGADGWNATVNSGPPPHPHRHHHAPRHRAPDYDLNTYNSTPVSPIDTRSSIGLGTQVHRYNSTPVTSGFDCQANRCIESLPDPAYTFNSTPTSPSEVRCGRAISPSSITSGVISPTPNTHQLGCVRTSRSEDHLQKESSMSAVAIDIDDDDVTSSLNTLLDTRPDRGSSSSRHPTAHATDRVVWTYNAPVSSSSEKNPSHCNGSNSTTANSNSTSVSEGISPQRSLSPASPTSVSSSVMSSASASSRTPPSSGHHGDTSSRVLPQPHHSISEAVSNISSPDYQDQGVDMFNGRECMEVSDPSDSDSTILVSEPCNKRVKTSQGGNVPYMTSSNPGGPDCNPRHYENQHNSDQNLDHRIVIQVKGPEKHDRNHSGDSNSSFCARNSPNKGSSNGDNSSHLSDAQELRDEEMCGGSACSSPEDTNSEADADSLHSFHYSPKAVDLPSAIRLAKRLYGLDGFKKSDVSRHLSKNNDFSRAVAEEYLRHFSFDRDTLDGALRKFLRQFCLTGETQERERVLVHFSRRFLDCNPGSFNSQDAVHTLTCAIMLLNTDLHSQSASRKMSCAEFIENLAELNDGDNFPREVLKLLYHAIKTHPLEWALDTEPIDSGEGGDGSGSRGTEAHPTTRAGGSFGSNPFLEVPDRQHAVEYKKGYVMRKCCYDANAKKTPFGKRSWKMFYCTLRDLILYLHKDEHGFRKNQMSDNLHNAIRIHHALATKATDYTKKQHVFRLQTADQAEYLFQTSDSKELQSWIDTINFVCAAFSAQPLAGAVGSQRKFQRPLLPCSHTKLSLREQLRDHDERCANIETDLLQTRASGASHNNREREAYLHSELKRYKTYAYLLRSRVSQWGSEGGNAALGAPILGELDETESTGEVLRLPPLPERNTSQPLAPNSRDPRNCEDIPEQAQYSLPK